jgi:hypothetical protein
MDFHNTASVADCTGMSSVQLRHRQVTHKHMARTENESNFLQNLTKETSQYCAMVSIRNVVIQNVTTVCLQQTQ